LVLELVMNLEVAAEVGASHYEQLLKLEANPGLRNEIERDQHDRGAELFAIARNLLLEAVVVEMSVIVGGGDDSSDPRRRLPIRQIVVPYQGADIKRELVLVNAAGTGPYGVGPTVASLYTRDPYADRIPMDFAPGDLLWSVSDVGCVEGPVSDLNLVHSYLALIMQHQES
jgi:hypothetical protein